MEKIEQVMEYLEQKILEKPSPQQPNPSPTESSPVEDPHIEDSIKIPSDPAMEIDFTTDDPNPPSQNQEEETSFADQNVEGSKSGEDSIPAPPEQSKEIEEIPQLSREPVPKEEVQEENTISRTCSTTTN